MDNLSRHYKRLYEQALDLVSTNKDAALDICWKLRADPKLSIYRRALVNLVIASALPEGGDSEKYAHECLDLLHLLRQEQYEIADEDKRGLDQIEEVAKTFLKGISSEKSEPKRNQSAQAVTRNEKTIWQSEPPSAEECDEVRKQAANAP